MDENLFGSLIIEHDEKENFLIAQKYDKQGLRQWRIIISKIERVR
jgi:hypothetical protein